MSRPRPLPLVDLVSSKAAESRSMYTPLITDRAAYDDACNLLDAFGDQAGLEASERAESARAIGNHLHFCHWRQTERLLVLLSIGESLGTVH